MKILRLAEREITTARGAFVMGIVNANGDSFWEGSRGGARLAEKLAAEGADIIDIGGESTRPGARYIEAGEETARVVPVVRALRKVSSVPISIDTRKRAVMEAAWNEGADILNDISALEDDGSLADFAALKNIPVVLMRKRGIPATMQDDTRCADVFSDASDFLSRRAAFAVSRGVRAERIIVDPGIGFGRDFAANAELLRRCGELCGGKYPVLVGVSRKSFVGSATGRETEGRLAGTLAANVVAVLRGASILRVHDVKETIDALNVVRALA